ncbi:MAG: terminase family protein [Planctomycetota bacterium]
MTATKKPKAKREPDAFTADSIRARPWQRKFYADPSRILVGCWARQLGKDYTTAAIAVNGAASRREQWYIVSLTQRQADQTFEKCKRWADMIKAAYDAEVYRQSDSAFDVDNWQLYTLEAKAQELKLQGGGSVISLPGRDPDALAGFSGNVIFTEFGLFPNGGYDHWRVVFPLVTAGHRVIVISTPRGKNTKFFELVNDPADGCSVHRVTIHDAIAQGFELLGSDGKPTTVEAFKALYGDEAGWKREYECEFTGDLDALIPWSKLMVAGDPEMPFDVLEVNGEAGWRPDFFEAIAAAEIERADGSAAKVGRFEIGWDVARAKQGDVSALWVNVGGAGEPRRCRAVVLMRGVSFALQRSIVRAAMETELGGVGCGDATGLGMDSQEQLTDRYGQRWQGVGFTAKSKSELGSLLVTAFDDRQQLIPPVDGPHKFIAADLYAIQREDVGSAAEKRLRLYETENPLLPNSHCDVAYAGALALKASAIDAVVPEIVWL